MEKYITSSVNETSALGREIVKKVQNGGFIALFGDLGAGKTAFVKGMVQSFLPDTIVTSPTYNIVNTYSDGKVVLHHYDMYRISDDDDLYSVGFYDSNETDIIVAEWSENIPWAIPDNHISVTIRKDLENENVRHIEMEFCNADTRS